MIIILCKRVISLGLCILLVGIIFLLASCANKQYEGIPTATERLQSVETATQPVVETEESLINPAQIVTLTTQVFEPVRTKYELKVNYDYDSHILKVNETITYVNNTAKPLDSIQIVLPFSMGYQYQVQELLVNNVNKSIYDIESNFISIPFNKPLGSGESLHISFAYTLSIPENGGILGRTSGQLNLADFYPIVPPYDVINGWIIHDPGTVGEYLVYEISDFYLEFSTNAPGDFQIFSNAPMTTNSENYVIKAKDYRNVVISICFDCVKVEGDYGSFRIIGGFDAPDENTGKETLNIIARSLVFFTEKFGIDYPHPEMTIIEAEFPDGMEYDGLFFLSKDYFDQYDQSFMNYLSLLTVHETAHQWWFGVVANDQALEPWLDEALATYSEYLFLEEFYPELTDWWWDFRVDSFNPAGSPGATIYEFTEVRPYINAVYLRGALFIHALRNTLSDEVFFTRLRTYAVNNQNMISNGEVFTDNFIPDMTVNETILLEKYFSQ